jgi:CheY-like chemotaxis protein
LAIRLIPEFDGQRVLLVDDDLRNLLALTPLLEGWGIEVTAAGDGNEALETLAEDPDYSIMLIDIKMPGMDGYDTIRNIRKDQRFKDLAIIALSGNTGADERDRCVEAGADDFLPKPVDIDALKGLIEHHLTN